MKIALAQTNPIVGDIAGNEERILEMIGRAADAGAELVVFPELSLIGYPPKDLLLKPAFIADQLAAIERIAAATGSIAALVGYAEANPAPVGRPLFNAAALLVGGRVASVHHKMLLPTYDVFDEVRYFESGREPFLADVGGVAVGVTICEDLWNLQEMVPRKLYDDNPIDRLAAAGAKVVVNMSASPFVIGKHAKRRELFAAQATGVGIPVLYCNQVGGNDELVFDGNSMAFDAGGDLVAHAKEFEEDLLIVDLDEPASNRIETPADGVASVHAALVLGLADYCRKVGFEKVVLGLSGGIDSSVVAAVAVEALGSENVLGISMPSRYSSEHSRSDAVALAENLGIMCTSVPIGGIHKAYEAQLAEHFAGREPDVTEENIQARIRGNILMAFSNKFGHMVLSTGNKSELAVGYCTLYGDMAGGLGIISDVPKTMVYRLARHINTAAGREIIPENVLTKPPSAELRPDQKDQDSLPPYDQLDAILARYVECEQSADQIISAGFPAETVRQIIRLVDRNEYKRKQASPGLKVTGRAFGPGRRMPIAQRYR